MPVSREQLQRDRAAEQPDAAPDAVEQDSERVEDVEQAIAETEAQDPPR